jgi:SSS family solute:Na+ symporter
MAGVAANVTSFNTVVTYDLIQSYFAKDRDSAYYLRAGRLVTIGGILISVFTAFIAKGYSNIMNYIQTLFSIFNAPLFATFIIAMFWKRTTPWAGFWGLIAGFFGAFITHELYSWGTIDLGSQLAASF